MSSAERFVAAETSLLFRFTHRLAYPVQALAPLVVLVTPPRSTSTLHSHLKD